MDPYGLKPMKLKLEWGKEEEEEEEEGLIRMLRPNQARKVPKIISCMIQNTFWYLQLIIYKYILHTHIYIYIYKQFIIKFNHKIKEAYTYTNKKNSM